MIAAAPRPTFAAQQKFEVTARRLRYGWSVQHLYHVVLTDAERARLVERPPTPAADRYGPCVRMWQSLHGGSDIHALLNVAFATGWLSEAERHWLLREYRQEEDPLAGLNLTCPADTLAIRLWPRTAYWNRELIDVRWAKNGASWDYLWLLAERSRMGQLLEPSNMSSVSRDPHYLSKVKNRLKRTPGFPASLIAKIEVVGPCHRFDLNPEQIKIYHDDCGLLVEAS